MPECTVISRATIDYFNSQDLVGQFISDNCTIGPALFMQKAELYGKFDDWCRDEQGILKPVRHKTLVEALEKRGIYDTVKKIEGKAKRVFVGINYPVTNFHEFQVGSLEKPRNSTDPNFKKVSNRGNQTPETTTGSTLELYTGDEQRQLWQDPEAPVY
jgi:phage/plasmid-associated DNA primase